jgi:hypothetical protein
MPTDEADGGTGLSPLRFSACARRVRHHVPSTLDSPHRILGHRLERVMHRRYLLRPVFRYPREPSHDLAGAIPV